MKKNKIAIFIIAYKAVNTLNKVLDRIPKEIKERVEEIFIIDDHSKDNTYYAVLGYKQEKKLDKLNIYVNDKNLGYGGNQKKGYDYAIKKGYDTVAMVHGDGQYAPEELPKLIKRLEDGSADMIFGSRILGNAIRGGMPLYKFLGNRILTRIENRFLKLNLSEYHSGYRIYNCHALKKVPYHRCSNDFHFDTDILIMFKEAGLKIIEEPIPTYYGDEISRVKVWKYGYNCINAVIGYWLFKKGLKKTSKFDLSKRE